MSKLLNSKKNSPLQKRSKSDEDHVRDMVEGSRKVMTDYSRKNYEFQCDPFRNNNTPRPQREMSRQGDTKSFEFEITVTVGLLGMGYVAFAPDFFSDQNGNIEPTGCYNNVNVLSYTTSTFNSLSTPAVATGAVIGVVNHVWTDSTFAANTTNVPKLQWQLNGAGMEIINRTNRLAADGTIYCYQSKSNMAQPGMDEGTLTAAKGYTEVSGAVYAEGGAKHVFPHKLTTVNSRSSSDQEIFSQNVFNIRTESREGTTAQIIGGSFIMVIGTAGNSINVRVKAGYSRIGSIIDQRIHFIADSRSADIIDNLISLRYLPSWFGYPSSARKGFLSHAYAFIHKGLGEVERKGLPNTIKDEAIKAGSYLWKELGLKLL